MDQFTTWHLDQQREREETPVEEYFNPSSPSNRMPAPTFEEELNYFHPSKVASPSPKRKRVRTSQKRKKKLPDKPKTLDIPQQPDMHGINEVCYRSDAENFDDRGGFDDREFDDGGFGMRIFEDDVQDLESGLRDRLDALNWVTSQMDLEAHLGTLVPKYWTALMESSFKSVIHLTDRLYIIQDCDKTYHALMVSFVIV